LGGAKSHSWPHVSDDNPFSEAQFKTLKYRPDFPDRFGDLAHAERHSGDFFDWYNRDHHHVALGKLGAHEFRQSTVPSFFDRRIERRQVLPHYLVQRLSERIVLIVDPWPPPRSGDLGQYLSAMLATCHCVPLSAARCRCCSP